MQRLDLNSKRADFAELEVASQAQGFWDDPQGAAATLRAMNGLRAIIETWTVLERDAADLAEFLEVADAEGDGEAIASVEAEVTAMEVRLEGLRFQLALGGEYDRSGVLIEVSASEGGTESQDWAQMVLRMYCRWAEKRGFQAEVVSVAEGDEAGIKSGTLQVLGDYAYGYARSERGGHRLVRISPFDGQARRHTSFARVEVMPVVDHDVDVQIDEKDVEMDVFRSSGAGGQHVNKTSSAVRLTHKPTGIVATCQNERSQAQNREVAMKILRGRLLERRLTEVENERRRLKGEPTVAGFGSSIRSYVLHPYTMVKDNRTEYETSNASGVLDGDLDVFMEKWLESQIEG
jgi:peptide chain release factor 2